MGEKSARDCEPDQDKLLLKRFVAGEVAAFDSLVNKYWSQVYYVCLKYLKKPECAADATQEAFIAAFSSIETFDTSRSFKPWLLKIAINKAVRLQKNNRPVLTLNVEKAGSGDDSFDPAGTFAAKQLFDDCLERLGLDDQILLMLRHSLDLSYEEMAIVLDKPVGSVKGELFRTRRKLKDALNRFYGKEVEAGA